MKEPADQSTRERFCGEIDRNFSLLAPAGSGKTRALVDRVVRVARSDGAAERLPRLVVVTYGERAAGEIRQRARNEISARGVAPDVAAAFQHAYFGTIHSFCALLLRHHGHLIGIPERIEVPGDLSEVWKAFIGSREGKSTLDQLRPQLLSIARFISLSGVFDLAAGGFSRPCESPGDCPDFCGDLIRSVEPAKGRAFANYQRNMAAVLAFESKLESGAEFIPLPKLAGTASAMKAAWEESFGPLCQWLQKTQRHAASVLGAAFRDYRAERGMVTFDDQVALAHRLIRHGKGALAIGDRQYHVILDEAQDTDPLQFEILLRAAGGPEIEQIEGGRFCMVGDPQQCIYGERADIRQYMELHERFARRGEGLNLSVTFRCSRGIIDHVNTVFPDVLNGEGTQADFVRLQPRDAVLDGFVGRINPPPLEMEGRALGPRMRHEARWLADWIVKKGYSGLGAGSWEEVAILCPRNEWFLSISAALKARGIDSQLHSTREVHSDSPATSWATALICVLAHPREAFEIVGVLRELFGLSDDMLATFVQEGGSFRIDHPPGRAGKAADALGELHTWRQRILEMPLRMAIQELFALSCLLDRLLSLPDLKGDPQRDLEMILSLAAELECSGGTLALFSQRLSERLGEARESAPVRRGALQFIGCKKAKGSEWDVVIVPFMSRPLTSVARGALSESMETPDIREEAKRRDREEFQRLMYVTLTRARKTLILVDDRNLFPAPKQGTSGFSLASILGPAALEAIGSADCLHELPEPAPASLKNIALGPDYELARMRSEQFIRRQLPHEDAARETGAPDIFQPSAGPTAERVAYGTWWHEFIRALPWHAERDQWESYFESWIKSSPDRERAHDEWAKFLESAFPLSPGSREWVIHPEMPFLVPHPETSACVEGIMDLAAWNSATDRWLLLDWKTDRGLNAPELASRYAPQIGAYRKALESLSGKQVESGIYSTVLGSWIAL